MTNIFDDPRIVEQYDRLGKEMLELIEQAEAKLKFAELKIAMLEAQLAYEQRLRQFAQSEEGATVVILRCNAEKKIKEFQDVNSSN